MTPTVKFTLSLLCALTVAACLGGRHAAPPAQSGTPAIAVGQTTKTELDAAFGPATAVSLDAGYDVWIYKGPATPSGVARFLPARLAPKPPREVVVLFDADGRVTKYRIREPRG